MTICTACNHIKGGDCGHGVPNHETHEFRCGCVHQPSVERNQVHDHTIFQKRYLTIYTDEDTYPTANQVRAQAEPMRKRIWDRYIHLQAIVQRYEAVIQRRWEKKSKVKRRETVVSVWGPAPPPPPSPRNIALVSGT